MNYMFMAESLLLMNKKELQFNYALLNDSNILKMLLPFAKEKVSKNKKSEIMEMVSKESAKYNYTPQGQLKRGLLKELGALYDLPDRNYATKKDVADQCERIIEKMYFNMLKTNKKFRASVDNSNGKSYLEAITKFQMMNLVESIEGHSIDPKQMDEIGESIAEFLKGLPEERQRVIAEKLGINNITKSSIQSLIATNGTAVVFATIVQVAGFAFYTTLTSAVAGIVGIVGITLPFVFYTTMTSVVAVIANPLVFLPIMVIGGGALLHHQNSKLKRAIAPVVIMQILNGAENDKDPNWSEILNE